MQVILQHISKLRKVPENFLLDFRPEVIAIQANFFVEVSRKVAVKSFYYEFPRPVEPCAEQMPCKRSIVFPAERGVQMQIRLPVQGREIACEIGYFHLLTECPVHVALGRRIKESERGLIHRANAINHSGLKVVLFAKCLESRDDFHAVVQTDDILVAELFVSVHIIYSVDLPIILSPSNVMSSLLFRCHLDQGHRPHGEIYPSRKNPINLTNFSIPPLPSGTLRQENPSKSVKGFKMQTL